MSLDCAKGEDCGVKMAVPPEKERERKLRKTERELEEEGERGRRLYKSPNIRALKKPPRERISNPKRETPTAISILSIAKIPKKSTPGVLINIKK
jgi:hypothetical protein